MEKEDEIPTIENAMLRQNWISGTSKLAYVFDGQVLAVPLLEVLLYDCHDKTEGPKAN